MKDPDFIRQPYWNNYTESHTWRTKLLAKIASMINASCNIVPSPDANTDMISLEQRINIHHLLNRVIQRNVQGEMIELGCYTGQTCVQIADLLMRSRSDKKLFLYDNFGTQHNEKGDIRSALQDRFNNAGIPLPAIIEGDFRSTIPENLPGKLSFVHIDAGTGQPIDEHRALISFLLEEIYPRMSKDAVCVLMDYHNSKLQYGAINPNPGVKIACDEFLSCKPEEVTVLYGGPYSHGYFVKE